MYRSDRFLTRDEINTLLDSPSWTNPQWMVLVSSTDTAFLERIRSLILGSGFFSVKEFDNPLQMIIAATRDLPDVIIVDDSITATGPENVIGTLKNDAVLSKIGVILCVSEKAAETYSLAPADELCLKDVDNDQMLTRRINALLYTTSRAIQEERKPCHGREWPRIPVSFNADCVIYDLNSRLPIDVKKVQLENISWNGALISRLDLKRFSEKYDDIGMRIVIDTGPLKGFMADSIIVRLTQDTTAGVRFTRIARSDQLRIADLY